MTRTETMNKVFGGFNNLNDDTINEIGVGTLVEAVIRYGNFTREDGRCSYVKMVPNHNNKQISWWANYEPGQPINYSFHFRLKHEDDQAWVTICDSRQYYRDTGKVKKDGVLIMWCLIRGNEYTKNHRIVTGVHHLANEHNSDPNPLRVFYDTETDTINLDLIISELKHDDQEYNRRNTRKKRFTNPRIVEHEDGRFERKTDVGYYVTVTPNEEYEAPHEYSHYNRNVIHQWLKLTLALTDEGDYDNGQDGPVWPLMRNTGNWGANNNYGPEELESRLYSTQDEYSDKNGTKYYMNVMGELFNYRGDKVTKGRRIEMGIAPFNLWRFRDMTVAAVLYWKRDKWIQRHIVMPKDELMKITMSTLTTGRDLKTAILETCVYPHKTTPEMGSDYDVEHTCKIDVERNQREYKEIHEKNKKDYLDLLEHNTHSEWVYKDNTTIDHMDLYETLMENESFAALPIEERLTIVEKNMKDLKFQEEVFYAPQSLKTEDQE